MKELIFSIGEIFDKNSQSGCLFQYEANYYHIPAYQRGYKWGSGENGAVTILLKDLWQEFNKDKSSTGKEYYLQYITVKPIRNNDSDYCLEVIDGQQRLTTLSLLLSTFSYLLDEDNLVENKLDYAIRENFFQKHVYERNSLERMFPKTWDQLIQEDEELNKQDVFYLFHALKKCYSFLSLKEVEDSLLAFKNFVLSNVKLIVNSVENYIDSETVFSNLNSNKVPLTESELIKGLFITKVGRSKKAQQAKHFQEILEMRLNIGRQWDEISNWVNRPDIKSFYFNNAKDGMRELLSLTAMILSKDKIKFDQNTTKGDFPLFNLFLNFENFETAFSQLIDIKNILRSWFEDNITYNYIGFLRFHKDSSSNTKDFLLELLKIETKSDLVIQLKEKKKKILDKIVVEEVSYSESPNEIHQVLLAINVFVEGKKDYRFDFFQYRTNNWTLEHIFPQTPEGKNQILNDENKKSIREMLGSQMTTEIDLILTKPERTNEEKETYYKLLRENTLLNSLGNMCLLTGSDNSSIGNQFFDGKRNNMLQLVRAGSFVPIHTFDVFSKMFKNSDTSNMKTWSTKDIEEHKKHIVQSLNLLK